MLMLVTATPGPDVLRPGKASGLASYLLIALVPPAVGQCGGAEGVTSSIASAILGFSLGIFGTLPGVRTVSIPAILAAAPGIAVRRSALPGCASDTMTLLCLLLFVGAMASRRSSLCTPGCRTR